MPIGAQIRTVIFPFAASKSVTINRSKSAKPEKKQIGNTENVFFRAEMYPHNKKDTDVIASKKIVCTVFVGAVSFWNTTHDKTAEPIIKNI